MSAKHGLSSSFGCCLGGGVRGLSSVSEGGWPGEAAPAKKNLLCYK